MGLKNWTAPLLFLGALCAGCEESDQTAVIVGSYPFASDCTLSSSGGNPVGRGTLDVKLAVATNEGYFMGPRVKNTMPSRMSQIPAMQMGAAGVGNELNNLYLAGFDVDIIPDPGQAITAPLSPGVGGQTRFQVPAAGGQIAPNGVLTGGVEVFPAALAAQVQALVPGPSDGKPYPTLTILLKARLLHGGHLISSSTFSFPVSLCNGCLQQNPNATLGGPHDLVQCPDNFTSKGQCLPQQDGTTSCCFTAQRTLVCTQ